MIHARHLGLGILVGMLTVGCTAVGRKDTIAHSVSTDPLRYPGTNQLQFGVADLHGLALRALDDLNGQLSDNFEPIPISRVRATAEPSRAVFERIRATRYDKTQTVVTGADTWAPQRLQYVLEAALVSPHGKLAQAGPDKRGSVLWAELDARFLSAAKVELTVRLALPALAGSTDGGASRREVTGSSTITLSLPIDPYYERAQSSNRATSTMDRAGGLFSKPPKQGGSGGNNVSPKK